MQTAKTVTEKISVPRDRLVQAELEKQRADLSVAITKVQHDRKVFVADSKTKEKGLQDALDPVIERLGSEYDEIEMDCYWDFNEKTQENELKRCDNHIVVRSEPLAITQNSSVMSQAELDRLMGIDDKIKGNGKRGKR